MLVSLPKQCVDDHNLVKSSHVQIETLENSLSITVGEGRKLSKEIEIEYPLSGEENIAANITGAYLLGYDIIKINGTSDSNTRLAVLLRNIEESTWLRDGNLDSIIALSAAEGNRFEMRFSVTPMATDEGN